MKCVKLRDLVVEITKREDCSMVVVSSFDVFAMPGYNMIW
jgi:hypothetical protein